jgi:hypothetical protein
MSEDRGLRASIEGKELVIRIELETLANAFEWSEYNNPYQMDQQGNYDYVKQFKITNQEEFAKGVVDALMNEGEDGSTLLTRMLDQVCEDAVESGCEGVDEIE